jgi:Fe-S cluster assembly protein SufD
MASQISHTLAACADPRAAAPSSASAPRPAAFVRRSAVPRAHGRVAAVASTSASVAAAAAQPAAAAAAAPAARAEDRWIAGALEALAGAAPVDTPAPLRALRDSCAAALATARMPTTKAEEWRFTDLSPLLARALAPPPPPDAAAAAAAAARHALGRAPAAALVLVDGALREELSSVGPLPPGTYVGALAGAPAEVVAAALGAQSRARGGPFAALNGAGARGAVVVHAPAGAAIAGPIHVLWLSSAAAGAAAAGAGGPLAASAPRLLIVLEEGASAEVVEEFAPLEPAAPGAYLVAAVAEVELDDGAALRHAYVVLEAPGAAHAKATLVNQGARSEYALVEARLGGGLTRHDVGVAQAGAATRTSLRAFLLASADQLHDLHSKVHLEHPDGVADQLHKCIAAHPSARGVFDGNVRVGRRAQRTDAGQLSRSLLLAPRASVAVKPNLQIVADDVKCTHGCAVSDLEEEQLFYLRARGIDAAAAREMLVHSFGAEVVRGLGDEALVARVDAAARAALAAASPSWRAGGEGT